MHLSNLSCCSYTRFELIFFFCFVHVIVNHVIVDWELAIDNCVERNDRLTP